MVGTVKANEVISKNIKVQVKDIMKPSSIPNAITDENIDINLISQYCTVESWNKMSKLVNKKNRCKWGCPTCCKEIDGHSIVCEVCLQWYHLDCVKLKQKPKMADWICRPCIKSEKEIKPDVKELPAANDVPLLASRSSWNNRDKFVINEKQISKVESLTPDNAPFRLYFDDLQSLKPRSMILGQVIDALFIILSAKSFKDNCKVYILPETFFVRIDRDISLEQVIPGDCADIDFIVAASFYKAHWTLVLLDVNKNYILYLDPLFGYVPSDKVAKDLALINLIIWRNLMDKDIETTVPKSIDGWQVITSNEYKSYYKHELPRQRNSVDCGMFVVMYFFYIINSALMDFNPGDMEIIRRWAFNVVLCGASENNTKDYVNWLLQKMSSNRLGGLWLKMKSSANCNMSGGSTTCDPITNAKDINHGSRDLDGTITKAKHFSNMDDTEKSLMMLRWIVNQPKYVEDIFNGENILTEDLLVTSKSLHPSVTNSTFGMHLVERFCSENALTQLEALVRNSSSHLNCSNCMRSLKNAAISCKRCLGNFHRKCFYDKTDGSQTGLVCKACVTSCDIVLKLMEKKRKNEKEQIKEEAIEDRWTEFLKVKFDSGTLKTIMDDSHDKSKNLFLGIDSCGKNYEYDLEHLCKENGEFDKKYNISLDLSILKVTTFLLKQYPQYSLEFPNSKLSSDRLRYINMELRCEFNLNI